MRKTQWLGRCPWRFRAMLPFALMMVAGTLALRFHYALDLVAGFLLSALALSNMPRHAIR